MLHNKLDKHNAEESANHQVDDVVAPLETHPWQPFIPDGTRMIFLGSFPPARHRWAMDFFYPNFINDMWRIFGICLHDDKGWFVDEERHTFHRDKIESMLANLGIGLYDTAKVVRRTRNTASDKDLQVITPTDVDELLRMAPQCSYLVTTGEKATDILASHFSIDKPKVGQHVVFVFDGRNISLYRMPSSSRAYPMKIEKKAAFYKILFDLIK